MPIRPRLRECLEPFETSNGMDCRFRREDGTTSMARWLSAAALSRQPLTRKEVKTEA